MSELPLLRADCTHCVALCCVAPAFSRSSDFAADKPAGTRCQHLRDDHRCRIHERLRPEGYPGCMAYDCLGAGQRLTAALGGEAVAARGRPETGRSFTVLRGLHELLWLLDEAAAMPACTSLGPDIASGTARVGALSAGPPDALAAVDLDQERATANGVLRACGDLARAAAPGPRSDLRGADLTGSDLRTTDLRGASLRGAVLVGADLRGTDLTGADLTGADLRGADLRGARVDGALFLGWWQLVAARTGAAPGSLPG